MDLGLAGKRVLVTGGASGLGAALVQTLAAEGAEVCLNYRSREAEAQALVDKISTAGGKAVAIQADLVDRSQVTSLFEQAVQQLGGLDILVNNAGLWLTCKMTEMTEDDWDRSIEVNLTSAVRLCQLFIQHCLADARRGRILNITSQAAFNGSTTGHVPYAVAKAGLVSLTRSLANEMGSNGITANCLAIGTMESPMIAAALEKRREYYETRIPIGYIASPQEVADVAAFLVSERSRDMTGATVDVSGGQLRH